MSGHSRLLRFCYHWIAQIADPLRAARAIRGLAWYASDYRAYRRMPGAEPMRLADAAPSLHERTGAHDLDAHYFYVNAWAMRRIVTSAPARHYDFASQTVLSAQLSSVVPTVYMDYRPLRVDLDRLGTVAGDLLRIPFRAGSIGSMSCLHVAEHIGLGRYGDPLDPDGTKKGAAELNRVLAPGGNLFFAVPVGRPRLCFNAHRIHSAERIREYFGDLELVEYSGVDDSGRFHERVALDRFRDDEYGCGMFWFRKAAS